ncbi:RNA recognition motif domain-containing protein [Blattabacterium cuenoti]|uniref:RNA recognition motif domain-containing protein n=1 Tax=Blattabacterium cuenoti TaxID=1653831 RepID=UPI00163B9FB7|nr:RNA-binding protein [Blattabacterium cuenoti]
MKNTKLNTKLYVGNLSYNITEKELKDHFESSIGIGNVINAKIIFDDSSYKKRSKGFGFIEMSNEEHAKLAIEKLNGTELMGRNIVVSVAKQKNKKIF